MVSKLAVLALAVEMSLFTFNFLFYVDRVWSVDIVYSPFVFYDEFYISEIWYWYTLQ